MLSSNNGEGSSKNAYALLDGNGGDSNNSFPSSVSQPVQGTSSLDFNVSGVQGLFNSNSFVHDGLSDFSSLGPSAASSLSQTTVDSSVPKLPPRWVGRFQPHFVRDTQGRVWKFVCTEPGCQNSFSVNSSSTTLSYHYKTKHRAAYTQIQQAGKANLGTGMTQTKIDNLPIPKAKFDKIVTVALEWIIADLLPFSTLDSLGFRALLRLYNPSLGLPCAASIRSGLVDHRISLKGQVKSLLDWSLFSGSLTADGWSSRSNKPFMGVTLHWLDQEFYSHECVLNLSPQPYPHTALHIARLIRNVIAKDDWDIQSAIASITTDSAPVMVKAAEIMKIPRIPCLAHGLHNSIKTSMGKHVNIEELVTKCHKLATFFHSSPKMAQALQQEQESNNPHSPTLVVIMDVVTRWNSTLAMLRRLLQLRFTIEGVLTQFQDGKDKGSAERLQQLRLGLQEWTLIEDLIMVLRPFEELTLIFSSSESGIAASIAPWVAGLYVDLDDLEILSPELQAFRVTLKEEVQRRVEMTNTILVASAFHPSFNRLWAPVDKKRFEVIKKLVQDASDALDPSRAIPAQQEVSMGISLATEVTGIQKILKRRRHADKSSGHRPYQSLNEMDRYFEADLTEGIVEPFQWWRENKNRFPVMAILARRYLAIPATSVASERMFSFSGSVVTDKRNRLSDDAVSDIVFCNYASKCLEIAKARSVLKS